MQWVFLMVAAIYLGKVMLLVNCILLFSFHFVGIVYTYDGTMLVSDFRFFLYLALSNPVHASRVVQNSTGSTWIFSMYQSSIVEGFYPTLSQSSFFSSRMEFKP